MTTAFSIGYDPLMEFGVIPRYIAPALGRRGDPELRCRSTRWKRLKAWAKSASGWRSFHQAPGCVYRRCARCTWRQPNRLLFARLARCTRIGQNGINSQVRLEGWEGVSVLNRPVRRATPTDYYRCTLPPTHVARNGIADAPPLASMSSARPMSTYFKGCGSR